MGFEPIKVEYTLPKTNMEPENAPLEVVVKFHVNLPGCTTQIHPTSIYIYISKPATLLKGTKLLNSLLCLRLFWRTMPSGSVCDYRMIQHHQSTPRKTDVDLELITPAGNDTKSLYTAMCSRSGWGITRLDPNFPHD